MTKRKLAVRVDEDLLSLLQEVAAGSGKNESDVIREALSKYLRNLDASLSCYQLAKAIGILGTTKSLPATLSTAKSHFKGFGR